MWADTIFVIMGIIAIWGLSAIFEQLEDIKKLLKEVVKCQ